MKSMDVLNILYIHIYLRIYIYIHIFLFLHHKGLNKNIHFEEFENVPPSERD